jgi:hypothetical protein
MTSLIACLTTGKGGWAHVSELMASTDWERTYLITNDFGVKNFKSTKKFEFVVIDPDAPLQTIKDAIASQLKGKIKDLEVAVNLASGSGKEHMALLSVALNLGLGVRIVEVDNGRMIVL